MMMQGFPMKFENGKAPRFHHFMHHYSVPVALIMAENGQQYQLGNIAFDIIIIF